jgi:hypothetical protein
MVQPFKVNRGDTQTALRQDKTFSFFQNKVNKLKIGQNHEDV